MKAYRYFILIVLVASLLAACASPTPIAPVPTTAVPEEEENPGMPAEELTPTPMDGAQGALPEAAQSARDWMADVLGVPVDEVEVAGIEQVTWTDSCLGLGGPAESCLRADTPGFRIQVVVGGRLYTLHTDAGGSEIRQVPVTGGEASQEEAGQAAADFIAALTGQPADEILVENVEAVDWPDSCLGVPIPDAMCAQVITPGYRVSLSAGGQNYEVHTDLGASNMALAAQP